MAADNFDQTSLYLVIGRRTSLILTPEPKYILLNIIIKYD